MRAIILLLEATACSQTLLSDKMMLRIFTIKIGPNGIFLIFDRH